jgi:hypothetical protein
VETVSGCFSISTSRGLADAQAFGELGLGEFSGLAPGFQMRWGAQ